MKITESCVLEGAEARAEENTGIDPLYLADTASADIGVPLSIDKVAARPKTQSTKYSELCTIAKEIAGIGCQLGTKECSNIYDLLVRLRDSLKSGSWSTSNVVVMLNHDETNPHIQTGDNIDVNTTSCGEPVTACSVSIQPVTADLGHQPLSDVHIKTR
ncbi:hypothetical protein ON010_g17005 [Phytophthora cinnamomi]|nr:hypothetical protein ON010_g17005 [Phytophthora cinnamomi]